MFCKMCGYQIPQDAQLLLVAAGATEVEVIECNSYNMTFDSNMDILSNLQYQIPGLNNLIGTKADVFVKYRYKYNDDILLSFIYINSMKI